MPSEPAQCQPNAVHTTRAITAITAAATNTTSVRRATRLRFGSNPMAPVSGRNRSGGDGGRGRCGGGPFGTSGGKPDTPEEADDGDQVDRKVPLRVGVNQRAWLALEGELRTILRLVGQGGQWFIGPRIAGEQGVAGHPL